MERVRLGFIGCGKHAYKAHGLVATRLPDLFTITAAFDLNPAAIDRLADLTPELYKARSAEDLLSRVDVDAVVIATPHEFHLGLLEKSVDAGKHILCEKPLWVGNYTPVVWRVIEKMKENKLILTSCHPRRYEKEYVRLRDAMQGYRNRYGRLEEFNFRFYYHKPTIQWKKSDSLLLDHMNHEIDLANFVLGHSSFYLRRICDSFDRYQVIGRRADGVSLCFNGYRRLNNRLYTNELELIFERGRVKVKSVLKDGMVSAKILNEDFDDNSSRALLRVPFPYNLGFFDLMRNFGEATKGSGENYLTDEDLIVNTASCNFLLKGGYYQV